MQSQDLLNYSKHLHYEITMLQGCFLLTQKPHETKIHEYAFLESFLIHARVLCAFLFGFRSEKRPKKRYQADRDSVIAMDYFGNDNQWDNQPTNFLDNQYRRINKALAHLTKERVGMTEWDTLRTYNELMSYMRIFCSQAHRDYLIPEFHALDFSDVSNTKPNYVTNTSVMINPRGQFSDDTNSC